MLNEKIKEALSANLDGRQVKQRSKGNFTLDYVEGWHVIKSANDILGFDGWSRYTVYCKEISRTLDEVKKQYKVGYEAKVLIRALGQEREGTGYGSGISKDLYDAIEGAGKEAETDAMKRAFITFGNPFGLALYDKDKEFVDMSGPKNVTPHDESPDGQKDQKEGAERWVKQQIQIIDTIFDMATYDSYLTQNDKALSKLHKYHPDLYDEINTTLMEVKKKIGA